MKNFASKSTKLLVAVLVGSSLSACFDGDGNDKEPNVAPVVSNLNLITQTETVVQDRFTVFDANADVLSFEIVTQPLLGTINIESDGSFIYTPNAEITGSDNFSFSASDGIAAAVVGTVNIRIEALQVSFAQFSRAAFIQDANGQALSVNGRTFTQDVTTTDEYQDLIDSN